MGIEVDATFYIPTDLEFRIDEAIADRGPRIAKEIDRELMSSRSIWPVDTGFSNCLLYTSPSPRDS